MSDQPSLPVEAPPPAPVSPRRHRSTVPRAARRWVLESVLIVASVLLAFGLNEYREARAERELTARMLEGIRAEIEYNLAALEPFVAMHADWVEALDVADLSAPDQSGLDVWFDTRPPFPPGTNTPFPSLRRSAWEAAVAGDALRLVDYRLAAVLTDVYGMQETAADNLRRLADGVLTVPDVYDPDSRTTTVRLLWLTLSDIQYSEALLLERYREHLPAVAAAAVEYR